MANAGETMSMAAVLTQVLESFQDPKFAYEVETFVNCSIPSFAVATQDGSHPIDWTMHHKKYKVLYETQLQRVVSLCDADMVEFMQYLQQCSEYYGADPTFQSLMTALTASEDYDSFLQVMFAAVRENWEPDPEAAAPPAPDIQVHEVDVAVPDNVFPGMAMNIEYLGMVHQVLVPEGFCPGSVLPCSYRSPSPPSAEGEGRGGARPA